MNEQEEVYSGLRSQDLQEAKDQLLVDTSDMLKIPLFTAEALLRNNGKEVTGLLIINASFVVVRFTLFNVKCSCSL